MRHPTPFLRTLTTLCILLALLSGIIIAQEPKEPAAKIDLTLAQLLALKDKPDEPDRMLKEIKAVISHATKMRVQSELLFPDGRKQAPPAFDINEKWVDGKWVVSYTTMEEVPGEDKLLMQAVTYDPDSRRFIRFMKGPNPDKEQVAVITREEGERKGEERIIRWKSVKRHDGARTVSTDTFSDKEYKGVQLLYAGGKLQLTVSTTATRVR